MKRWGQSAIFTSSTPRIEGPIIKARICDLVAARLRRLRPLSVVAAIMVLAPPAAARAGDSPFLVVGDWGVGEIDGRILFYLGAGRHWVTPIPAPPQGPRWDVVYNAFPFVAAAGAVVLCLYCRRHRVQPTAAARRGFEVEEVPDGGPRT